MNVTIELPDDIAVALRAQAQTLGLTVEEWLGRMAAQQVTPQSIVHLQKTNPREWARQFREWADNHDPEMPVLPDEAMSRDSIYPDRA